MRKSGGDTPSNSSQSATDSKPTPKKHSFIGSLFGRQESGLVMVIILMMGLLTLYGMLTPSIEQKTRIQLHTDATIVRVDSDGNEHEFLAANKITGYRVTLDGETREYTSKTIERYDSTNRTLIEVHSVNRFLNKSNLVLIAKDASFFAIIAVGMTGVIILAGIDLSVGSIYGLSAIVGAMALSALPPDTGWYISVPVALVVCMTVGTLCGLANGSMSEGLGVHPFVITLGMMAALRGLTVVIPQQFFGTQSIGGFPSSFTTGFFKAEFFGVYPVPVFIMICCGVAGWFVLSRTVFGRRIFAIGGNETAAKYAGIPVKRVKILVYTITGALCGLSACVYLGYLGAAETNAGNAYELQVIAATVIGGASLMGGRGTVIGAVLGAIIIQLINNTLIIFEVDTSYNQIVMGAAIIIAVVIDQTKQRIQARRA
ncbi:MAG: ABC transporter permease [Phycisphaerales bacterium]|nr:ABC transporter permease [Phycisphaerales bacterium]